MLWQMFLTIASVLTSPFRVSIDPDKPHDIKQGWIDPDTPYHAKPYGPRSWHEAQKAAYALYGHGNDMILPEDDAGRPSFGAIKGDMYRWPNKKIPYAMSPEIANNKTMVDLLKKAIKHIQDNTCLKFVLRTNEVQYVYIIRDDARCYAEVGYKKGARTRFMSLGEGCQYVGIVIHELLHSAGMYHEHQRDDRDNYIKVYMNHVQKGQELNFEKTDPNKEDKLGIPYNCDSIMHYGSFAFSKDPKGGLLTMVKKDNSLLLDPWERSAMNATDIQAVKLMYKC